MAMAIGAMVATGCREDRPPVGLPGAAVQDCPGLSELLQGAIDRPVVRQTPQAQFQRAGWQGGREPEGKPGSGVAVYYRFASNNARPDEALRLNIGFANPHSAVSLVAVYGIDGARLQAGEEHSFWRLQPEVVSEIALTVTAPASGGAVVAATCHNAKISMRNIPLPGRQAQRQTPSGEHGQDANGSPIVNMQAPLADGASRP